MINPTALEASDLADQSRRANGVEIRQLDWDTSFFGVRMGLIAMTGDTLVSASEPRSEKLAHQLRQILADARTKGYAHLIFRVPSQNLTAIWAAEQAGLRLVDIGVDSTFSFGASPAPSYPEAVAIRLARSDDLPVLRDLAARAFVHSRFAADPFFSDEQVAAFHRQWITNLCSGLAHVVLVCEREGLPVGFVSGTLSGHEGRIPLIAVKDGFRGQGLGQALIAAMLGWFGQVDAEIVRVKTQAHNYAALALYQRAGFIVSDSEITFSVSWR